MNFDEAFQRLLVHEGGLVNNRNDPGGKTKFGISQRAFPNVNIEKLTVEESKALYKEKYWDTVSGDLMPPGVRFDLFDGAVNSGPAQAIRWLQRAAGVADDGEIGPITVAAAVRAGPLLAARYNGHRLAFMTDLGNWQDFSRGWARRIAGNLKELK